jgi:hypothetical protein
MHISLGRFQLSAWSDWSQFWSQHSFNWIDFRLLHASAEWSKYLGGVEVDFGFAGFNLRLEYTYDYDTPFRQRLRETVEELGLDKDDAS